MDAYLNLLLSMESPVLPGRMAMLAATPWLWAIVLGGLVVLLAAGLARAHRLALAAGVILWTLTPGPVSPAYWLALAFQTPSLMSATIGLGWLAGTVRPVKYAPATLKLLTIVGVVLGWALLLDTLALFPVSLYAWGFSPLAVVIVALVAGLIWAAQATAGSALPFLLLVVFVLSRLPTGNVWDALLDPWLWASLQIGWLVNSARQWRQRRSLATTRA